MLKKILLITTTLALVLSLLSACAAETENGGDVTAVVDNIETTTAAPVNERLLMSDDLPEMNFNDAEFRILYRNGCARSTWAGFHALEVAVEAENGDIVNDAVYRRNARIEERFNTRIKGITYPANGTDEAAVAAYVKKCVLSADDAFDAVITWSTHLAPLAASGLFLDWYKMPNIDLSKPWWMADALSAYSVGGKSYLAMSDLTYQGAIGECAFMMFNKDLVADFGLEDPYKLVWDNKWTMDKMISIARETYRDTNGDGVRDDGDIYGFASDSYGSSYAYLWDCGSHIVTREADGTPVYDMGNERTLSIFEKVYELFYECNGSFIVANKPIVKIVDKTGDQGAMFAAGKAVFLNDRVGILATPPYRSTNVNYGVLPNPKLDEKQEKYLTMLNEHAGTLAIPVYNKNPEMAGTLIEALSAESYKTVVPAYYETALKVKYSQDEETVRILDLILEGRVYDFALLYNITGYAAFQDLLSQVPAKRELASWIDKNTPKAEKELANVLEQYGAIE